MKETTKRVYYIDNLRWMTVSLLILYHAAMAYNTWGEANYIFLGAVKPISSVVVFISPWFMPLMFLLAGMSSKYSLRKRGYKSYMISNNYPEVPQQCRELGLDEYFEGQNPKIDLY